MKYIFLTFAFLFSFQLAAQQTGMNLHLLRPADTVGYIVYTDSSGLQNYHSLDSLHTALGYKNPDSLGGQLSSYYLDFTNLTNLSTWLYNDTIADNELQVFSITDYIVTGDTIGAIVENSQNGSQFIIADGNGARARKNGNIIEISLDSAVVDISVNNPIVTLNGSQGINITNGSFSLNQSDNQSITISLDEDSINTADEITIQKIGNQFSLIDPSSQASVNNSGTNFIQDITLDSYGRVTGITTANVEAEAGVNYWQLNGNDIENTNADNIIANGVEIGRLASTSNIVIGSGFSSKLTGSAIDNIFIGDDAGWNYSANATGNILIGKGAGQNGNGTYNLNIGYKSGEYNTGVWNTNIGYQAGNLGGNVTGNVNIGYRAGYNNSTSYNLFIGKEAGFSNTTGYRNIMMGEQTGYYNTIGGDNVFLGSNAGYLNDEGNENIFIGAYAGFGNSAADGNTFIGYQSGLNNSTGSYNFFLGHQSGYSNQTGANNFFLGYRSGYSNTSGSNNIFLGKEAGYYETGSDKLYIDNTNTSTPLIYGDFASDSVVINGTIRPTGGIVDVNTSIGTLGQVLSSNGSGVEWVTGSNDWTNITNRPNGLDDGDDNNYPTIMSFGLNTLQLGRSGLGALSVSLADIAPDWSNITNIPAGFADGIDQYYDDWNIVGDVGGITNITENYTVRFEGTGGITTIWDQSTGKMFIDGQNVAHDWNNITNIPSDISDGDNTINSCYLDVTNGADPSVSFPSTCDELHISIHGGGSQLFLPIPLSALRGKKVYITFFRSGSPTYDYDITCVGGASYIAYKGSIGSVRVTDQSPTIVVCTKYAQGTSTFYWQVIKSN